MARTRRALHADTLEATFEHFNAAVRQRYRLPSVEIEPLSGWRLFKVAWESRHEDESLVVLRDPNCALLARLLVSHVPRFAIGVLDQDGRVQVEVPEAAEPEPFFGRHALLVNPLGGIDNWDDIAGWIRSWERDARRTELAGLAAVERPDRDTNRRLILDAIARGHPGIVAPPDEGTSGELLAEVAYVYGYSTATIEGWQRQFRTELRGRRPGAPRKNP